MQLRIDNRISVNNNRNIQKVLWEQTNEFIGFIYVFFFIILCIIYFKGRGEVGEEFIVDLNNYQFKKLVNLINLFVVIFFFLFFI